MFLKLFLNVILLQVVYGKLFPIEEKYPLLGNESPPGSPWPFPSSMNGSSYNLVYLNRDDFNFEINIGLNCDIIADNVKRYRNILFPPKINIGKPAAELRVLNKLIITIDNATCPGYPDTNIDESYELKINGNSASIKAKEIWGALRAVETFSQLTFITDNHLLALNDSTLIKDSPRFKYRGLMLDTARHFIPIPILKKQLDAMAYNKFNVFHWHIVDDQSFPLQMLKYPDVTTNGRYSESHVYTQDEVKDILQHARLRGIRVIPEFDSPGHVAAFGSTFPELITVCWNDGKPYQSIYSVQAKAEIFNPTIEALYPVVRDVLTELKNLFKDEYIHLGNDEVYYECWKSNPNISEWMKTKNFTEYHELEAYYSERLLAIVKDLNKKATVWQDVYDNGVKLEKTTQIQIWKDTSTISTQDPWQVYLDRITKDGYPAILSSPWYLNFISYGYQDWYRYYLIEPFSNFTGTPEQAKLLYGGEACLWAEYVDGTNIESRLWPRASAVAERLWSPASLNNVEDAKFRLDEHRCRLLRRGITAQPVLNGYCGEYEVGMKHSVVNEPVFNYYEDDNSSTTASDRSTLTNTGALTISDALTNTNQGTLTKPGSGTYKTKFSSLTEFLALLILLATKFIY